VVATFTDADPQGTVSDYSATVAWGDGITTSGTVGSGSGSAFTVTASHSYAQLGFHNVTVTINDAGGATASTTTTVVTFASPAGGNFVVGTPATLGARVNFWGAQWSINNPSGGASSFKGWATSPAGPSNCGGGKFTAATGDSEIPPATVPAYMAVLVTNGGQVVQNGSVDSGPVVGIVVVQTLPGYGTAPGLVGNATVVAATCGLGGHR
jgi:hypothetical protein